MRTLIQARGQIARPAVLRGAFVVVLAVLGIGALSLVPLPGAIDWDETFRPAVIAWLSGGNVYSGPHPLYNPPWLLPLLLPFAILPYSIGRAALLLASLATLGVAAKRFGATPGAMALFLLVVPTWDVLALGNVEWLVALGLLLPRPAGMLLLALKPQASAAVVAFYVFESWRDGGIRGIVKLTLPLAIVGALSLVAFGLWPLDSMRYLQFRGTPMDYSFFPKTIPVGLALLIHAFRKRDIRFALPASPCLFPGPFTPMSWAFAILPLVSMPLELAAVMLSILAIALANGGPI